MMHVIFPWQQAEWQLLQYTLKEKRLPHALLLTGMPGIGKAQFAIALIYALLCQRVNDQGEACGVCHSCRTLMNRTHPNVVWVEPEKPGHAIKVDQIREMNEFVQQSSMQDGLRVVMINPANNLNINAANALLKTLEEPAKDALIILVAQESDRLPKTIVSRCQRIAFPPPKQAFALTWLQAQMTSASWQLDDNEEIDEKPKRKTKSVKSLQRAQPVAIEPALLLNLAQGAPLAALQLWQDDILAQRKLLLMMLKNSNQDPLHAAKELADHEPILIIDFMLSWLLDLLRLQLQMDVTVLTNQDALEALTTLKDKIPVAHTLSIVDYLQTVRKQLNTGVNFNKQLLLENIFIKWGAHVSG